MIRDKRFKKFYETGNNKYYVLPFGGELYLGTESVLELPKKFFKKKELTQTIKLIELSVPILSLFSELINTQMIDEDKEFPDMCTYEKVNNSDLRKVIRDMYDESLNTELSIMVEDFNNWCDDLTLNNSNKYTEEEIEEIIKANQTRIMDTMEQFKQLHISKFIKTNIPNKKTDNDVVKKMITSGLEFLYSHQLGANAKVYYLYDLDKFGTITIYKVMCVKEVVKSIDSFIYDRTIAQELLAYIENNKL